MNSTNLDGGSDFNVKEGVKKLIGSVKKKRILVCKFKNRSAGFKCKGYFEQLVNQRKDSPIGRKTGKP